MSMYLILEPVSYVSDGKFTCYRGVPAEPVELDDAVAKELGDKVQALRSDEPEPKRERKAKTDPEERKAELPPLSRGEDTSGSTNQD